MISSEARAVTGYYLAFSFLFILIHLGVVSIVSFFHFMLDHDMNTIENGLTRNAWEILVFSKGISLLVISRILQLNSPSEMKLRAYFFKINYLPTSRAVGLIIFLLILFYALIHQFGGGIEQQVIKQDVIYSSYLGAGFYFFIDFMLLYILQRNNQFTSKQMRKFLLPSLVIFFLSTKVALPYLDKFYVFLLVHFLSIFLIGIERRVSDVFCYCFFVIAPLSSIYGIDIVWENAFSVLTYKREIPIIGVLCIWTLALGYYLRPSSR